MYTFMNQFINQIKKKNQIINYKKEAYTNRKGFRDIFNKNKRKKDFFVFSCLGSSLSALQF